MTKTILFQKNDGMKGEIEPGTNITITGEYLDRANAPSGVRIELGVDTKGGIYIINHDTATTGVFVNQVQMRAEQAWYLNAPQFDDIEIANGAAGSFFLHSRQLNATDRRDLQVGDDVTHQLWITNNPERIQPPRFN